SSATVSIEIYTLALHDALPILKTKVDIAKPTLEEKPELFGRVFSKEDWKTLKKEGHLGLVDGFVNKKTGEEFSAYVSLDKDINEDRKSTRLNSSHVKISYAVFC